MVVSTQHHGLCLIINHSFYCSHCVKSHPICHYHNKYTIGLNIDQMDFVKIIIIRVINSDIFDELYRMLCSFKYYFYFAIRFSNIF